MTPKRIARILYTYSWNGYSIALENGKSYPISGKEIVQYLGQDAYDTLHRIAHSSPLMVGCYRDVPSTVNICAPKGW